MDEVNSEIIGKNRLKGPENPNPGMEEKKIIGWCRPGGITPAKEPASIKEAVLNTGLPFYVVEFEGHYGIIPKGKAVLGESSPTDALPLLAWAPPVTPGDLGDPLFMKHHGTAYPYVAGSMAHGISSPEMVRALAGAGFLGFFGTAGISPAKVESLINDNRELLEGRPHGFNIIHSPNEPRTEEALIDLYLREGVRLVEASAFMGITLPLVRFRTFGLCRDEEGRVMAPCSIIAKVSRVEVARQFMSPPSQEMLTELVNRGEITVDQAKMAREIPMAVDVTVEADSGGHTDNRPAISQLPSMTALRDRIQEQYKYREPLRVGLGGGISTPRSAAAAFSMGAAYVVTGSVNQACVEAGTSGIVRELLAQTGQADVTMAPAADMFEMGVRVQVLKRGTMFAMRARKLYDLYSAYESFDVIPSAEQKSIEKSYFRASFNEVWQKTRLFFMERDPSQAALGDRDPKHRMALVFRWYLSQASHWAIAGEPSRRVDYQVWCGPAMGAFNEWTRGSFLEKCENRKVANVARNLLYGAGVVTRLNFLKVQGVNLEPLARPVPLTDEELDKYTG